MTSISGRPDRSAGVPPPRADGGPAEVRIAVPEPPMSADAIRELHQDLVRRKRRAFFSALPLLLLAAYAWAGALTDPRRFGGLALFAVLTAAMIGQIGYHWWTLRGTDPMLLYERESRDAAGHPHRARRVHRAELIAHEARTARVVPAASLALTGTIVAVTAVQFIATPTSQWLAAAGLLKPAVKAGQWWRLLTYSYLHGSIMHIIANAGGLMMLGRLIETYDRRMRVPLIYLFAALGGSILSTLTFPQSSVGASAGILGLAGYLAVNAGRPASEAPEWIRRKMLSILGMTVLIGTAAYSFIDNAAHAGGALTGATLAFLLGPGRSSDPPDRADAFGAAAALVLAAGAVFTIARLL